MAESETSTVNNQYVSFALGKEIFALDVMKIRGVERLVEITTIPKFPEFVEGVINLRKEIIPIVDMRKRFGLPESDLEKEKRIVFVEMEHYIVGLIVDRVFEVMQIDEEMIGQMPTLGASSVGQQFVKGVAEIKDKLVIMLDIDKIFSDEEAESLSDAD